MLIGEKWECEWDESEWLVFRMKNPKPLFILDRNNGNKFFAGIASRPRKPRPSGPSAGGGGGGGGAAGAGGAGGAAEGAAGAVEKEWTDVPGGEAAPVTPRWTPQADGARGASPSDAAGGPGEAGDCGEPDKKKQKTQTGRGRGGGRGRGKGGGGRGRGKAPGKGRGAGQEIEAIDAKLEQETLLATQPDVHAVFADQDVDDLIEYAQQVEKGLLDIGADDGEEVGDQQDKEDEIAAGKTLEQMVDSYKTRILSLQGLPEEEAALVAPEQDPADRQDDLQHSTFLQLNLCRDCSLFDRGVFEFFPSLGQCSL